MGQTKRDPAPDPCLSFRCLWVEGGPEFRVPWVTWAEVIEVPLPCNPTCFNILGNTSIQRVNEQEILI